MKFWKGDNSAMRKQRTFTAIIHQEDNLYVAECPEVGTVSQGTAIEVAIANLKEATELYIEEMRSEGCARPAYPQRNF